MKNIWIWKKIDFRSLMFEKLFKFSNFFKPANSVNLKREVLSNFSNFPDPFKNLYLFPTPRFFPSDKRSFLSQCWLIISHYSLPLWLYFLLNYTLNILAIVYAACRLFTNDSDLLMHFLHHVGFVSCCQFRVITSSFVSLNIETFCIEIFVMSFAFADDVYTTALIILFEMKETRDFEVFLLKREVDGQNGGEKCK